MTDLLGYQGKRVVIAGCFSGMGAACARLLVKAGAEVHGVDIKPSPVSTGGVMSGLIDMQALMAEAMAG